MALTGAAAVVRALEEHEITLGEFVEAVASLPCEALQLIAAVLGSDAAESQDCSERLRLGRQVCLTRAANLWPRC